MIRGGMLLALWCLCACTPGGVAANNGGGVPAGSQVTKIDVNLTVHSAVQTAQGTAAGYAPIPVTVAVGTYVEFMNSDSFAHTASLVGTAGTFPAASPLNASAQQQSGAAISLSWSTGTLQAGALSKPIRVDAAGTYLFGCFFHYGAPMRGVIDAH
jgi:plastocyanin